MPELTEKRLNISEVKGLAFKGGRNLFIRHVLGFAINFTGGIFIARLLGPEVMGLYFISFTLLIVLRQLIDFGISVHFIRLPSAPGPRLIKNAYAFQQAIAVAGTIISVFFLSRFAARWYGHEELAILIAAASIGAYFNSWQSIPLSRLEREMDYKKIGFIEVSEILVFNLAAVTGAFMGHGIYGLAAGSILRGFVPAVISVAVTGMRPAFSKETEVVKSLIHSTSPILGSNLVLWIIMAAPPVIVGSLSGTRELGLAQLAYTLLGNTMFIATIFQRISLSSLSKFQDDPENFNKAVQRILQILFLIYIPLTMGLASISPWWVTLIYGSQWAGMDRVILIAAIPVTTAALLIVLLSALYSKGLTGVVLKQNIVHAVIYWAVMWAIASKYGAVSVPAAHLVAMSAGYMFIYAYSKECGKLRYKPLAAWLLAGAGVMSFSWYMASKGAVYMPFILWPLFIAAMVLLSSSARQAAASFLQNVKEH